MKWREWWWIKVARPRLCTLIFKSWRFDALQFSPSKFWREGYYPEGTDQVTRADLFGDGGGRLYRGGCIFSLYSNCCQTLTSYFMSGFFHPTSEDQVPIRRPNWRNTGWSNHGAALHGCSHPTQARSRICDSRWEGVIAVKASGFTRRWNIRAGRMWGSCEGYNRGWSREIFSNRIPTTPVR